MVSELSGAYRWREGCSAVIPSGGEAGRCWKGPMVEGAGELGGAQLPRVSLFELSSGTRSCRILRLQQHPPKQVVTSG